MKYFIFAIALSFSFSCSSDLREVKLSDNQAILEACPGMEWVFGKNYKNSTLLAEDIKLAEKLLNECFAREKTGIVNPFAGRSPGDYMRQFIGAENEAGEKIILINCFSRNHLDSFKVWKTSFVKASDGGNNFFHLKINVTKGIYYDLQVNTAP